MKKILLSFFMCMLAIIGMQAETVTYTITSASAVSTTGQVPEGSSATFENTYTNNKQQLTKDNSMTLTLSGYDGCTITGITLSMKSNKSAGAGSFTAVAGSTIISSISGSSFNTPNWNGSYTQDFVNINPAVTPYTVLVNETVVLTIAATTNSLYCQSFTITYEPAAEQPGEGGGETPEEPTPDPEDVDMYVWTLVKDVSTLDVGDKVVIVATVSDYALSTTQNNNNRGQAAVVKNGETITFGNEVQVLTLEEGTVADTWAFNTGSGYLYAASSSSNYLRTQASNDANGSWKITIANDGVASVVAQGANTKNIMRYNSNNTLFSCYGSGQQDIALYRREYAANITYSTSYLLKVTNEWKAEGVKYAAWFENKNMTENNAILVQGVAGEVAGVEDVILFYLHENHVKEILEQDINFTHVTFMCLGSEYEFDNYLAKPTNAVYSVETHYPGDDYYFELTDNEAGTWNAIPSAVNRVELADGIGYAYGVVSAEGAIEVYNVNGAVVARGNDNVDLRGLGSGVYIIRNGNQVRKVVR